MATHPATDYTKNLINPKNMNDDIRDAKNNAYQRAIQACEQNETLEQVIDDLKNIIRAPEIYE